MSVADKKPTSYAERVGQLIRMLGSNVDGERAAAFAALDRTLRNAGLDFHAIASAIEPLNDQLDLGAELKRVWDAGCATVPKAEEPRSLDVAFRDVDGKITWQSMALFCQQRIDHRALNGGNKEFIADMAAKVPNDNFGHNLTPKQLSYLQILYFKLGGKP